MHTVLDRSALVRQWLTIPTHKTDNTQNTGVMKPSLVLLPGKSGFVNELQCAFLPSQIVWGLSGRAKTEPVMTRAGGLWTSERDARSEMRDYRAKTRLSGHRAD